MNPRSKGDPAHDEPVLDLSLIRDPQVTARNRLPMRQVGVFTESIGEARAATSSRGSESILDPGESEQVRIIDGRWLFRIFDSPEQVSRSDVARRPTDWDPIGEGWDLIEVPGAWTLQGPQLHKESHEPVRVGDGSRAYSRPHYTNIVMPFGGEPPAVPAENPTAVYRTRVEVPAEMAGRWILLRLGAAESVAEVFVDGESIGATTDSRLPSEFRLDVEPGSWFDLAIAVTRFSAQSWLEDQDQWWHAGIQRSVSIHAVPQSAIAAVKALPGLIGSGSHDDPWTGVLDLDIRVDGDPRTTPGWTVEAWVEARTRGKSKGKQLATTDRMALMAWDGSSEAASVISGMFIEPGVVRRHLEVPEITPWSHEDPQLYRLLVALRDPRGRVVHVYAVSTGFRSVAVADNELLINGQPVLINGVNLHEHSPWGGRCVRAEDTARALRLMKRSNINAIRAAHYPHDEHLARLCDELGLYLVDEANIESHGRQVSLCHDERFTASMLARISRMVERDQNHPSVVIWSLGNESGYGAVHDAAAAWVRRHDPTRPLQYEGPFMHNLYAEAPVSDIVCPMYTQIADVVRWSQNKTDDRRPLVLCEYSHAMGNSNGSLADYWDAFERTPGLQGGFIWEWTDHGLFLFDAQGVQRMGPTGSPSWGYGGDFGDVPNDSNFVCDGLVSAAGEPRPAIDEVTFVGRPVSFEWAKPVPMSGPLPKIEVLNRRWFKDTSDLELTWQLTVDGEQVRAGELDLPAVAPRDRIRVPAPFGRADLKGLDPLAEVYLDLIVSTATESLWAPVGHVLAVEQLLVSDGDAGDPAVPVDEAAGPEAVSTDAVGAAFVDIAWRPTVFRALTDNDGLRNGWMRGLNGNLARWVEALGLDRCDWNPGSGSLRTGSGHEVAVRRTIESPRGRWQRLTFEFDVPESLRDLPRLGIEWELPASGADGPWESLEWFGDGPHESYPDRPAATRVGSWFSSIDEMYVDYAVPQEHANREGLRWLALRRGDGARREGLLIVVESLDPGGVTGRSHPSFGVRRHGDDELWAAAHTHDLHPVGDDPTWLYINVAHRGLGTASCGPDTLGDYHLGHGSARLTLAVTGFDQASERPHDLYTEVRCWRSR